MANKKILMGMLAMVLVFGIMVVGCDDGSTNSEKTIIITGVSGEYLKVADYMIFVDGADGKIVAQGDGHLSGSTITCDLYTITLFDDGGWNTTSERWTGKGSFDIGIAAWVGGDHTEWIGRTTNIVIDKAETTIPFSQFH